jgi:hypothetical protein
MASLNEDTKQKRPRVEILKAAYTDFQSLENIRDI